MTILFYVQLHLSNACDDQGDNLHWSLTFPWTIPVTCSLETISHKSLSVLDLGEYSLSNYCFTATRHDASTPDRSEASETFICLRHIIDIKWSDQVTNTVAFIRANCQKGTKVNNIHFKNVDKRKHQGDGYGHRKM